MLNFLRKSNILGINERIIRYINPNNNRKDFPKVDNKYLTDALAREHNIQMPPLYAHAEFPNEITPILNKLIHQNLDFVIKPAQGAQGNGIMIVPVQECLSNFKKLRFHCLQILSGAYSLNQLPDTALFQKKIESHSFWQDLQIIGIPDIRIILLEGYPIMAMCRLPTSASQQKANLHQGAVGVGVDLSSGHFTHAVCEDRLIDQHPDTGITLQGRSIPDWKNLLTMASRCYEMTGLGYLGVDLSLDKDMGPILIEVNARPGLSIQLANQSGLKRKLEKITNEIQSNSNSKRSPEQRVEKSLELLTLP